MFWLREALSADRIHYCITTRSQNKSGCLKVTYTQRGTADTNKQSHRNTHSYTSSLKAIAFKLANQLHSNQKSSVQATDIESTASGQGRF